MAEPHDLLKARRESAALLNLGDVERLSPADALRCDLISTLRLAIDGEQATVLDGGSADLAKLITATENLIRLLPGRALPEPDRPDDHEATIAPLRKLYRYLHEQVHALSAENAQLRAALGLKGLPNSGEMFKAAGTPGESDIAARSEIGQALVGKVAGPDEPPLRAATVLSGTWLPHSFT